MITKSVLSVVTSGRGMSVTITTTEPAKRERITIDCADEDRWHDALGALIVFSEIVGGAPLDVFDQHALHSLVANLRGTNGND